MLMLPPCQHTRRRYATASVALTMPPRYAANSLIAPRDAAFATLPLRAAYDTLRRYACATPKITPRHLLHADTRRRYGRRYAAASDYEPLAILPPH